MTEPFEIKRRISVFLIIGLVAAALAVAFGVRAYRLSEPLLWILVAVLLIIAVLHLVELFDARIPLCIADEQGVRLRTGEQWVGLRWEEMGDIRVERREGLRFGPRLKILNGDGSRMYSASLGFATNVSPAQAEVQLAQRRVSHA